MVSRELRFADGLARNCSKAAFTSSGWVQATLWGPPFEWNEFGALHQFGGALPGDGERNDPVGVSVNHQRGDVDLCQTSSRKSSCHVGTHATLAVAPEIAATFS